jgi:hypothetical protein
MSAGWGKAWEQCYRYFGVPDREFCEEIACLRLAFYLANYGMFRSSSKLFGCEHYDLVKVIRLCRQHSHLRDREPSWLLKHCSDIVDFLGKLENCLRRAKVSPTYTLTTKICMATTASVVGYDRFVRQALRANDLCQTPSARGLSELYQLSEKKQKIWCGEPLGDIPVMKQIDHHFWMTGQNI